MTAPFLQVLDFAMDAERLLQHFDRIAEAPDAVAHLRRFILDLAVRGKLVDQDPNDEPASELLKRIQAEKARLVKEDTIKKGKQFSDVEVDEIKFDIPVGWKWVRIRQVTSDRGQAIPSTDFTYIDVTAINKECGNIEEFKVLSASEAPSRARKLVRKDDVIYSCVRPYLLNIAVVDTEIVPPPIASTAFAILYGFGLVLPRYLWITLRSPFMVESVEAKMRGQAYPAINDADFAVLPIPLPPLAEQHRIVAKVDELMGLCDRLQSAQQNRESQRDRLVAASLHHLKQSADGAGGFGDRARFYFNHLSELTVRSEHIKQLRQTILNLAVRGNLVPQDPNDGLVSITNKNPKIALGKTRKIQEDEDIYPCNLPASWIWQRVGNIAEQVTDGEHATPQRIKEQQIPLVTAKNVRDGSMDYAVTDWVSFETAEKAWRRCRPTVGDILLVCVGATTGRLCILQEAKDMVLVRSVALIRPSQGINVDYLALSFRSPMCQAEIWKKVKVTAQPCLYINRINSLPIPIPPLAEQHRIVAKVDELMGLCDRLETQLSTTQAKSRSLLKSLLYEALAPSI